MFHRASDASKAALVDLCHRWHEGGGAFVDVQLPTEHLERMGALTMSRQEFLAKLAAVRDAPVRMVVDRLPVSRLAPAR
jgi:leucyl/phenylalanyl-tRNA--protein transferase